MTSPRLHTRSIYFASAMKAMEQIRQEREKIAMEAKLIADVEAALDPQRQRFFESFYEHADGDLDD